MVDGGVGGRVLSGVIKKNVEAGEVRSWTVEVVSSIWDEQKVLGKVRAYVKGRVAGDGGGEVGKG